MTSKITLLGTGTCQLQTHRTASSILVNLKDVSFMYDIGRGTTMRLAELGIKQDDLQYIILSHFHPDHVSDLIPLLHAARWSRVDPRTKDLHVYGPTGVREQVMRLINVCGPGQMEGESFQIHVHEITENAFQIGAQKFSFVHLPPVNNHGLKFEYNGKTYALTGDSDVHQPEIAFLQGVDVAVIDAGHPADEEIVALAVQTNVPTLILSHLYREIDETAIRQQARQKGYEGTLIVGKDLMSFEI